MASNTEELGENFILDVEEDFLKDKCFCVRSFYRASRQQFKYFFFGLTILVICSLVAIVLMLDKMGIKESLIYVLIILVTFLYSGISLYTWAEFAGKEEYLKKLRNSPLRGVKTQPPRDLDEEEDEVFSLQEEAVLQEKKSASRKDSSGGEELLIPSVGDEVDKNVAQHLASVCVHHPAVSSGESSSSAEILVRIQDSAANSEGREGSDEEFLQALSEVSSMRSTEASFESAANSGDESVNGTASSNSPEREKRRSSSK